MDAFAQLSATKGAAIDNSPKVQLQLNALRQNQKLFPDGVVPDDLQECATFC